VRPAVEVPVEHAAARAGELLHSSLDTSKLRGLGWEPRTSLAEGLGETYRFIRDAGARRPLAPDDPRMMLAQAARRRR
jgi:nucleoside-diphosphate-sugar epimerase